MYSTKTIHKNINPNYPQTYTSIGDPYSSSIEDLPGRWKKKQFVNQRCPKNAQNGFFVKTEYHPEPYTEVAVAYSKSQPLEKRKLGFGSKDAFKSGEFTSTKATERYRDIVRKEKDLLDNHRDLEKEKAILEKCNAEIRLAPKDKNGNNLKEPKFLYDIGRSHVTQFNPNSPHDTFYNLQKHAPVDPKWKGKDPIRRLGTHRPFSATYGEMAWGHKCAKPKFGQSHCVDKFYDRGHLESS